MVGLVNKKEDVSLLKRLLESNYFSYIDSAFAKKYATDEQEQLLLAYIFLTARRGHLAVQINKTILPSPESFQEGIVDGIQELYSLLKTATTTSKAVVKRADFYYLKSHWEYEQKFCALIDTLRLESVDVIIDKNLFIEKSEGLALLPQQKKAILHAASHVLTLIVGGPGTGKTYTAAHFLALFWQCLSHEQKSHFEVAIAAPTGKAAAHLQSGLKRVLEDESLLQHLHAGTLHALLDIRQERDLFQEEQKQLSADLVIVDESSMIDVRMMLKLLASLKKGARLVLIGDPYQLPPVEAGSLFADFCDIVEPVTLTQCMRCEYPSIVQLAIKIKEESPQQVLDYIEDLKILHEMTQEQLLRVAEQRFPCTIEEDLSKFSQFRMLSPLRKGQLGVDSFNEVCKEHLRKKAGRRPFVAPIILSESCYKEELYNGETGLLLFNEQGRPSKALFNDREIAVHKLPRFEYAYLMSVHKSQGSEFDEVLILMPEGSEHFGRELFYTAVTRAKKKLLISSSPHVLLATLHKGGRRFSSLYPSNSKTGIALN